MSTPDFNLLITLDAVLAEGSVAGAARRLRLSPSAMSRALARLRETTGDPLLVRAGRGLVPTPRAVELREQVSQIVENAKVVLRPESKLNLKQLLRTFTLRASEGFVENFGPDLIARVARCGGRARRRGARWHVGPAYTRSPRGTKEGGRPATGPLPALGCFLATHYRELSVYRGSSEVTVRSRHLSSQFPAHPAA